MAAVYHKLLRDLVGYIGMLDEIVEGDADDREAEHADAWRDSFRIARDRFETILKDWGCAPIKVNEGVDEFDPELHESVEPRDGDVPDGLPEQVVAKVRRRGWKVQDYVLQYPQVVVS